MKKALLVFLLFLSVFDSRPVFAARCKKDSDCLFSQFCENTVCVKLCRKRKTRAGKLCTEDTPVCYMDRKGHDSYCGCSETSCYDGMRCVEKNGRHVCEPCPAGDRCSCPAGSKANGEGLCERCEKDEDCICPGKLKISPDGRCVLCAKNEDCLVGEQCYDAGTLKSRCDGFVCEENEYATDHECKLCSDGVPHCKACFSATACTDCEDGYALRGGKCMTCDEALNDPNCSLCKETACQDCKVGYTLQDGRCKPVVCPEKTFLKGSDCLPCEDGCQRCTSEKRCLECSTGFEFYQGVCKQIPCAEGFYLNGDFCEPCIDFCDECKNSTTCEVCQKGYLFDPEQGKCVVRVCPSGFYKDVDSGLCEKCKAPHCSKCMKEYCEACDRGYALLYQRCTPVFCIDNCEKCTDLETCTLCKDGYRRTSEGKCEKVVCPKGTYRKGTLCRPCPFGCADCDSPKICKECEGIEFFMSHDRCRPCFSAISGCQLCDGPKKCVKCQNGQMPDERGLCPSS